MAKVAFRYITDGTFSMDDVRPRLSSTGELLNQPSGDVRFVPDDPSFPTTVFRQDGIIEFQAGTSGDAGVAAYLDQLASWLGVSLHRIED